MDNNKGIVNQLNFLNEKISIINVTQEETEKSLSNMTDRISKIEFSIKIREQNKIISLYKKKLKRYDLIIKVLVISHIINFISLYLYGKDVLQLISTYLDKFFL